MSPCHMAISLWASVSRDPEQAFDSPSPVLRDKPFTECKGRAQRGQTHRDGSRCVWGRGPRCLQGQEAAAPSADVLSFL